MLKASSINLPAPAAGQPAETLFAAPDELEIQPLADISRLLEGTGIVLLEEHKQLIEEGHQVAILDAIRILREQNLLTQQNIEAIFSNSEHAKNISEALAILKTRKIDAKTWVWGSQQQILSMILSGNGEYAVDIATALCDLSQRDSMFDQTLATREHREAILRENGQHAKSISAALLRLDKEGILAGIWNEENRKAILTANGQYADRIAEALCFLYRKKDFFEGRLLNRDNRAAILAGNGQYAVNIAYAISDLEKVHILTKENRTAILANNGADAGSIAQSLVAAEKRRHGY